MAEVKPRVFFLNERQELSPGERPSGGRVPTFEVTDWKAKAQGLVQGLKAVEQAATRYPRDPTSRHRFFLAASPVAVRRVRPNIPNAPRSTAGAKWVNVIKSRRYGVLTWDEDTATIESAMARFHSRSGMCAALARVVKPLATARFGSARGVQISPEEGAVYLVPADPARTPFWGTHVYVETAAHAVDALTGKAGHETATYRQSFWLYSETHRVREVDPETIDVGIQTED